MADFPQILPYVGLGLAVFGAGALYWIGVYSISRVIFQRQIRRDKNRGQEG